MNLEYTNEQINDELIEVEVAEETKYNLTIKGYTHVLTESEMKKIAQQIDEAIPDYY